MNATQRTQGLIDYYRANGNDTGTQYLALFGLLTLGCGLDMPLQQAGTLDRTEIAKRKAMINTSLLAKHLVVLRGEMARGAT